MEKRTTWRRWLPVAIIGALLVIALVWLIAANRGPGAPAASVSPEVTTSAGSTDPAASPSAAPTSTAATPMAPPASAAPPAPDAPIAPEAAPVAPDEPAEQAGVRVELATIERVEGIASAPGEISGPALRITVRITNGSTESVDVGLVAVNAYYGEARRPASSIMQPGGDPFDGVVEPGGSAEGVYLFETGGTDLADVLIGVDVVPGQPTATFRGDLR